MSPRRRTRQRTAAFIAATAAALLGVGLSATPASAHTPTWTVTCSEVSVDLTAYNPDVKNTVTIEVDGKELLPTETFKREFHKKIALPKHSNEVPVHLVVEAGDGKQFSHDETKDSPVCEDDTPTPTPSAPSETPSDTPTTETPEPSDSPSTSSAAPAPQGGSTPDEDLAETGASSSTPLIAGAAAVVVLAGGGLVFASRKRRAGQH